MLKLSVVPPKDNIRWLIGTRPCYRICGYSINGRCVEGHSKVTDSPTADRVRHQYGLLTARTDEQHIDVSREGMRQALDRHDHFGDSAGHAADGDGRRIERGGGVIPDRNRGSVRDSLRYWPTPRSRARAAHWDGAWRSRSVMGDADRSRLYSGCSRFERHPDGAGSGWRHRRTTIRDGELRQIDTR